MNLVPLSYTCRESALARGVGLDVFAELEVDLECAGDAGVEHAHPVVGGWFELGHVEQIARLHDDLQRVREIVGQPPDLNGEVFGDLGCLLACGGRGDFSGGFGHGLVCCAPGQRMKCSLNVGYVNVGYLLDV
jgi:hypothetical protein